MAQSLSVSVCLQIKYLKHEIWGYKRGDRGNESSIKDFKEHGLGLFGGRAWTMV